MENKLILILLFFTFLKVYCKIEKINFFLTNYEIARYTDVNLRKIKYLSTDDTEKSIQFNAFNESFVLDLSVFYPREDSEVVYISKLRNITDSFLGSNLLLHYGYVRGVKDSYVVGFFTNNKHFRGYMLTDEVYCIEPYAELKSLIIYKFKDVIVPGCAKISEDSSLDCAETLYFAPWKSNKPPKKRISTPSYSLFYDKYFELFNRLQAKSTDNATKKKEHKMRKNGSDLNETGYPNITADRVKLKGDGIHNEKDKKKGDKNESKNGKEEDRDHSKDKKKEDKHRSKDKKKEDTAQRNYDKSSMHYFKNDDKSNDEFEKSIPEYETKNIGKRNKTIHNDHKAHNKTIHDDEESKRDGRKTKSEDIHQTGDDNDDEIKKDDGNLEIDARSHHSEHSEYDLDNVTFKKNPGHEMLHVFENTLSPEPSSKRKRHLQVHNEKLNSGDANKNNNDEVHEPILEALEDNFSELQCNVEFVIGPTFRKKFEDFDEDVLKDIFIQTTLLNKIFRKVSLEKKGSPYHLTLNVERIVIYGDEVYSPFRLDADLEYFTKMHLQKKQTGISIGLVNRFLRSAQLFDGYVPEGGGGTCAVSGNTLIISHGNENTPAPMALFFAALMRGVTRSLGANDKDPQCHVGSYPNPMQVLQDFLLSKEIKPSKEYSIFTTCNIKEIDKAMMTRKCFLGITNPLCGNGILDEGEQCDCGPDYLCDKVDPCCNLPRTTLEPKGAIKSKGSSRKGGCTLIRGAQCSKAEECCVACQIDKQRSVCFSGKGACDVAMCDGESAKCPSGTDVSDGMVCSEYNDTTFEPLVCRDDKCELGLCSGHDLKPCTCAPGTGRDCVYCCLKDGRCRAAGYELKLVKNRNFSLPDGVDCMGGECLAGECVPSTGMNQILNYTIRRPPIFPESVNACCNVLPSPYVTVSLVLCFLSLFLCSLPSAFPLKRK